MEAHIVEWLNLSVRWVHMITGIAWIGASFYFNFLENSLNRTVNLRDELAGNLWAIHGGGFYYLEKYKISPQKIPEHLHWFKWEAYFTFLSGFTLLTIVYYYNAEVFMLDASVSDISTWQSIGMGVGTLIIGWLVYDQLCKSSLVNRKRLFSLVSFILVVATAYVLSQFLSARAAYMHVGAMLGTIMVANVFYVIIPSQKAMVASAIKGEKKDPSLGEKALARSIHNNYMTLPVLFIMISNHFPSTYGNAHSWVVLSLLVIVGVAVRHWFNLKGKGQKSVWLLPLAILIMGFLVYYTRPVSLEGRPQVSDAAVMTLVQKHCIACHSQTPSSAIFSSAPKGVMFDDIEQIKRQSALIKAQAVQAKIMPLGNSTGMTEQERQKLGAWIAQNETQE
ncbi:MAG: urate hydroxylase PuuD [bacterium]